jgi:hypothetical protein
MPYSDPATKRAYDKMYREANREKIKEAKKKYREANREKINEKNKEYKEKNVEKTREYSARYFQENKEKIYNRRKELRRIKREEKEANKQKVVKNSAVSNTRRETASPLNTSDNAE